MTVFFSLPWVLFFLSPPTLFLIPHAFLLFLFSFFFVLVQFVRLDILAPSSLPSPPSPPLILGSPRVMSCLCFALLCFPGGITLS